MLKQTHVLYTAEQTRELDRIAIQEFEISGTTLMERAGAIAFSELQKCWPDCRKLVVFCGTGNNGGDGFVLARLAREQGMQLRVYLVGDENRISGDALGAYQRLQGADFTVMPYEAETISDADVIVDALLGTGLNAKVNGEFARIIDVINTTNVPVLALDVPSGLDVNTGRILGTAVQADVTVTFIGNKQGMHTLYGPDYCGRLVYDGLHIPGEVYDRVESSVRAIRYEDFTGYLPPRPNACHKGNFGHVLVVGGDTGMPGAVRLAAEAALRSGSGLVSVATRAEHVAVVCSNRPELMAWPVRQDRDMLPLLDRAQVVAVGPGLGREYWGQQVLTRVLESGLPMVVDADGLIQLNKSDSYRDNWILTPHPGEAARLLGMSVEQVQENRFAAVKALSVRYGGIAVLKGNGTLISNGVETWVCDQGNPGMATAGMGDVLSGIIASLAGQGLPLLDAARLGVCLHACAGDTAARGAGERGLLASDLMPNIRRLANP